MPDARPHQVWRQQLLLRVQPSGAAGQLQFEAYNWFEREARRVMDQVLDEVAGPARVVRLERLELDLGRLPRENWQQVLTRRLELQLRAVLSQQSGAEVARSSASERLSGRASHEEVELLQSLQDEGANQLASSDARHAELEGFLFFLEAGRLPWWQSSSTLWREAELSAELLVSSAALQRLLRESSTALTRLVHVLKDDVLETLVLRWAGIPEARRALECWVPADASPASLRRWRAGAWREILAAALQVGAGSDGAGARLVGRLLAASARLRDRASFGPRVHSSASGALESGSEGATAGCDVPEPWRRWLGVALQQQVQRGPALPVGPEPAPGDVSAHAPAGRSAAARTAAEPGLAGSEKALPPSAPISSGGESPALSGAPGGFREEPQPASELRRREPRRRPRSAPTRAEAVAVRAAGLVLLHPFLSELFLSQDLLAKDHFVDAEARALAVHLAGYLAFGRCDIPEQELLLPKLLCGMAWEEPLPPLELEDARRAACDELMSAVLRHWVALKSSSAAWLREMFLLRPGVLEAVDQGQRLNVERRVQDVLLGKLPWGVGLVRLPWMQQLLHVNWN